MAQEETKDQVDDFDFDDEFDPLEVNDDEINPDEMDDDNPYDTVDYPMMRNGPEEFRDKNAVFTPEAAGGAKEAMLDLIDRNMGRKPAILTIIDMCRGEGCKTSDLKEAVDEAQRYNKSVFTPMMLCRMLERAGGLTVVVPEPTEEREIVEDGIAYLEIKDKVDPTWTSTDEALEVYEEFANGNPFRDIVFDRDAKYYDVYLDVMDYIQEQPRSLDDVDAFVENYEVCKHPRRYGGHFIDMLERVDAIMWYDGAWNITDLGRDFLAEMKRAKEHGLQVEFDREADNKRPEKTAVSVGDDEELKPLGVASVVAKVQEGEKDDEEEKDGSEAEAKQGAGAKDDAGDLSNEASEGAEPEEKSELETVLEGRIAQYNLLSRLFAKEIRMADIEDLQGMRFPVSTGNHSVDAGYYGLYTYLRGAWDDSERELAIDFARTFIGHGVNGYSAAYPYESVYTSERRLMMQEARAEVLKILRENELKRNRWNDGEDHIAVELEFMQVMGQRAIDALRAGDEDGAVKCLETSREFIHDHLLNWVPMFNADIQKFARTEFYRGLGMLLIGYLEVDAETLEEILEKED